MFSYDSFSLSLAESAERHLGRPALHGQWLVPAPSALGTGSENEKSLNFPRTGTETKVQVQIVYLGGNTRKLPFGGVGKRKGREGNQ